MRDGVEIIRLLQNKQLFESECNALIYGTIEIRKKGTSKYIYLHYRNNGKLITKYVGEYSDELYNLILYNNMKVKKLKKQIREINRILEELKYTEKDLSMKVKENIDFVRKNLGDIIQKQILLEEIKISSSNIKKILNNESVSRINPKTMIKIINLKRTWEYVLNKDVIAEKSNYELLCQINKLLEESIYYTAGEIQNIPKLNRKDYKDKHTQEEIKIIIQKIMNKKISDIDKAIELLLFLVKEEIFVDGNINTAIIFANHFLISKGRGIIIISEELLEKYNELLHTFLEGKGTEKFKSFIKETCYYKMAS